MNTQNNKQRIINS